MSSIRLPAEIVEQILGDNVELLDLHKPLDIAHRQPEAYIVTERKGPNFDRRQVLRSSLPSPSYCDHTGPTLRLVCKVFKALVEQAIKRRNTLIALLDCPSGSALTRFQVRLAREKLVDQFAMGESDDLVSWLGSVMLKYLLNNHLLPIDAENAEAAKRSYAEMLRPVRLDAQPVRFASRVLKEDKEIISDFLFLYDNPGPPFDIEQAPNITQKLFAVCAVGLENEVNELLKQGADPRRSLFGFGRPEDAARRNNHTGILQLFCREQVQRPHRSNCLSEGPVHLLDLGQDEDGTLQDLLELTNNDSTMHISYGYF